MAAINAAIQKGIAEKTVLELMNPEAQLPQVYPFAADLYQKELATLQQQSPEVSELSLHCLEQDGVEVNLIPTSPWAWEKLSPETQLSLGVGESPSSLSSPPILTA